VNLALTGAGISVESGIPDFRSPGGLWERYDIMEYGSLLSFRKDPEKVWTMLSEMYGTIAPAQANAAHLGLGRLERLGYLHAIITQNIDNLHQEGGSRNVIEYHGNFKTLSCLSCRARYDIEELLNQSDQRPPKCRCGEILKPDVILFGEAIPGEALRDAYELAASCRALLVVGTSASVTPASTLPGVAKQAGATIIEINIQPTHLTESITDIFLAGKAGEIVPQLVTAVERVASTGQ
jgi:NAD-dependent deacetylase